MQILDLRHPSEPYPITECGLVLGNFDGVHRGHKALIAALKRLKAETKSSVPLGAFCFTEPPSRHFGVNVPQLTDNQKKIELLRREGLQFIILCDFPTVANLSPEEFVAKILIGKLNCKLAVCGYNYSFGKGAAGSPSDLVRWLGSQGGREVRVVDAVKDGRHVISSSVIRTMLQNGHPEDAARLLGYPYAMRATVTEGKQYGRKIGVPTANLNFDEHALVPAFGVYAATVRYGRKLYPAIANVGVRPTFDDGDHANCEVYLIGFNGYLYDKTLEVSFLHYLREERKFDSPEALREQIQRDIAAATEYL